MGELSKGRHAHVHIGANWKALSLWVPPSQAGTVCVGGMVREGEVRVRERDTGALCTPGAAGESMVFHVILAKQEASFTGGRASQGLPGGTQSPFSSQQAVCTLCPACWTLPLQHPTHRLPKPHPARATHTWPTLIAGGSPQAQHRLAGKGLQLPPAQYPPAVASLQAHHLAACGPTPTQSGPAGTA